MTDKAFELRQLTADDIFPMFQIISKIGVREFKSCFESEEVRNAIMDMASGAKDQGKVNAIGLTVAVDIAGVIISNLYKCKDDIYQLLSQLSGMKTKEIASLPMPTFLEMIIAVVKKEEFKDFFQGVTKLLK
jgi:hypothetical protein|nr:MAG TPA: hypothetical protein [Caudoviricetes sp.]